MQQTNTRRGYTQMTDTLSLRERMGEAQVRGKETHKGHPEFISGSTPFVTIQNKEERLKQVQHDNRRGFTLIELLVVVLIIGILAAIAMPQYTKAVEKSRIATALPVIDNIKKSMELWLTENGWPNTNGNHFLWGDNSGTNVKKVETSIDVRAGLDCSRKENHLNCWDANFDYEAICNNGACYVDAYRSMDAYNSEGSYFLDMIRYSSSNQWEYGCYYFDDFGRRACSTLQGQGNWQIVDGNE